MNESQKTLKKDSKIYVAGHRGMVGSAITRLLKERGFNHIVYRSSTQLDLRKQTAVEQFFETERPEYVFLAAARVGGILANSTMKADFLYDNLMIQSNVIHASYLSNVKKLLFLGSSCIYPKLAPQPLKESYLLSGYLEPTNDSYAISKIAGIKMCQAYHEQYGCHFISVMPTNLYGPNDNYDLETSHVFPALLRKIHEAKKSGAQSVSIWGSGEPKREFLHVDDLAKACLYIIDREAVPGLLNIGSGKDISISELAVLMADIIGYRGSFTYDRSKPDGTPRKLLDVSKINKLGWQAGIGLKEGIEKVYNDIKEQW